MAWVRKLQNKNEMYMLVIPAPLCRDIGWRYGDCIAIILEDGKQLRLLKIDPVKRPDLVRGEALDEGNQ